ncbi:MAG: hypothetical protein JXP73_09450 [Deltaproteobacteria bacterium]|nr:hypothetical protein [Deltaproteobacteria bacterium]
MPPVLYGCGIRSNLPLLGLAEGGTQAATIDVEFRPDVPYSAVAEPPVHASPQLTVRRTGVGYHFAYRDGTEFVVTGDGSRVMASTPAGASHEDTCTYLVGPVFGFLLRLRGAVCLHASVAVVGGRAVVVCGAAGSGKSSIAAAFACSGYPVMADDVAVLDDRGDALEIVPGYPRINLWPDMAQVLCGSSEALPAITPNWQKRYLPLHASGTGARFHAEPAGLAVVYVLAERIPGEAPSIRGLGQREALLVLLANSYTSYLLDQGMRAREFGVLGRLVRTVPVRQVSLPEDLSAAPALCETLVADIAGVGGSS